ncbi:MAG: STAS domain-containing protein [Sinobacteraceae bacterium]|nr:STAS domain-containing protein [Nevskiaceae bacterium]
MIAFAEARRAGLLAPAQWPSNIIAGTIVGIVALPLAMAFAIASGARPEQGLYTSIVAGFAVAVLGGTRVQIAGPTGAFVAILAGVTARYGIAGLEVATFMAGVILVLMGMARMGAVIRFIPSPVIMGFTAGIGVIIFVGQWRDFFGLPPVSGQHFHQRLWELLQVLPRAHASTTGLATLSLVLVAVTPRIRWLLRVPGPLLALLIGTGLQSFFQFHGVATLGSSFGGLPRGLPALQLPDISLSNMVVLIGPAFTIALLGAIESLLSAVVADGMTGATHDANQELIGQGVANILLPFFGGFAATGAIARTATSIRNGASSPLAAVVHCVLLVSVLLVLAPLAANIPLAVLAAILFAVAWKMSEPGRCVHLLRRAPPADRIILIVTFLLTVFADLVVAVNVGVLLAVLQFLRRMADAVDARRLAAHDLKAELAALGVHKLPEELLVYEIAGPMFFGAVDNLKRPMLELHPSPKVLILRLHRVPFMDITGIQALEDVIGKLHKRGVRVLLCEANARVQRKLERAGLLGGDAHPHLETLEQALRTAKLGGSLRSVPPTAATLDPT